MGNASQAFSELDEVFLDLLISLELSPEQLERKNAALSILCLINLPERSRAGEFDQRILPQLEREEVLEALLSVLSSPGLS